MGQRRAYPIISRSTGAAARMRARSSTPETIAGSKNTDTERTPRSVVL
jgi:hypothetical protein